MAEKYFPPRGFPVRAEERTNILSQMNVNSCELSNVLTADHLSSTITELALIEEAERLSGLRPSDIRLVRGSASTASAFLEMSSLEAASLLMSRSEGRLLSSSRNLNYLQLGLKKRKPFPTGSCKEAVFVLIDCVVDQEDDDDVTMSVLANGETKLFSQLTSAKSVNEFSSHVAGIGSKEKLVAVFVDTGWCEEVLKLIPELPSLFLSWTTMLGLTAAHLNQPYLKHVQFLENRLDMLYLTVMGREPPENTERTSLMESILREIDTAISVLRHCHYFTLPREEEEDYLVVVVHVGLFKISFPGTRKTSHTIGSVAMRTDLETSYSRGVDPNSVRGTVDTASALRLGLKQSVQGPQASWSLLDEPCTQEKTVIEDWLQQLQAEMQRAERSGGVVLVSLLEDDSLIYLLAAVKRHGLLRRFEDVVAGLGHLETVLRDQNIAKKVFNLRMLEKFANSLWKNAKERGYSSLERENSQNLATLGLRLLRHVTNKRLDHLNYISKYTFPLVSVKTNQLLGKRLSSPGLETFQDSHCDLQLERPVRLDPGQACVVCVTIIPSLQTNANALFDLSTCGREHDGLLDVQTGTRRSNCAAKLMLRVRNVTGNRLRLPKGMFFGMVMRQEENSPSGALRQLDPSVRPQVDLEPISRRLLDNHPHIYGEKTEDERRNEKNSSSREYPDTASDVSSDDIYIDDLLSSDEETPEEKEKRKEMRRILRCSKTSLVSVGERSPTQETVVMDKIEDPPLLVTKSEEVKRVEGIPAGPSRGDITLPVPELEEDDELMTTDLLNDLAPDDFLATITQQLSDDQGPILLDSWEELNPTFTNFSIDTSLNIGELPDLEGGVESLNMFLPSESEGNDQVSAMVENSSLVVHSSSLTSAPSADVVGIPDPCDVNVDLDDDSHCPEVGISSTVNMKPLVISSRVTRKRKSVPVSKCQPLILQLKSIRQKIQGNCVNGDVTDQFPSLMAQQDFVPLYETLVMYAGGKVDDLDDEYLDFGEKVFNELAGFGFDSLAELGNTLASIHSGQPKATLTDWVHLFSKRFESMCNVNELNGSQFDAKLVQLVCLHFCDSFPEASTGNCDIDPAVRDLVGLTPVDGFEMVSEEIEIDEAVTVGKLDVDPVNSSLGQIEPLRTPVTEEKAKVKVNDTPDFPSVGDPAATESLSLSPSSPLVSIETRESNDSKGSIYSQGPPQPSKVTEENLPIKKPLEQVMSTPATSVKFPLQVGSLKIKDIVINSILKETKEIYPSLQPSTSTSISQTSVVDRAAIETVMITKSSDLKTSLLSIQPTSDLKTGKPTPTPVSDLQIAPESPHPKSVSDHKASRSISPPSPVSDLKTVPSTSPPPPVSDLKTVLSTTPPQPISELKSESDTPSLTPVCDIKTPPDSSPPQVSHVKLPLEVCVERGNPQIPTKEKNITPQKAKPKIEDTSASKTKLKKVSLTNEKRIESSRKVVKAKSFPPPPFDPDEDFSDIYLGVKMDTTTTSCSVLVFNQELTFNASFEVENLFLSGRKSSPMEKLDDILKASGEDHDFILVHVPRVLPEDVSPAVAAIPLSAWNDGGHVFHSGFVLYLEPTDRCCVVFFRDSVLWRALVPRNRVKRFEEVENINCIEAGIEVKLMVKERESSGGGADTDIKFRSTLCIPNPEKAYYDLVDTTSWAVKTKSHMQDVDTLADIAEQFGKRVSIQRMEEEGERTFLVVRAADRRSCAEVYNKIMETKLAFELLPGNRPRYKTALDVVMDSVPLPASGGPGLKYLKQLHILRYTGTSLRELDGELCIEGYDTALLLLAKRVIQQSISMKTSATSAAQIQLGSVVSTTGPDKSPSGAAQIPSATKATSSHRTSPTVVLCLDEDRVSSTTELEHSLVPVSTRKSKSPENSSVTSITVNRGASNDNSSKLNEMSIKSSINIHVESGTSSIIIPEPSSDTTRVCESSNSNTYKPGDSSTFSHVNNSSWGGNSSLTDISTVSGTTSPPVEIIIDEEVSEEETLRKIFAATNKNPYPPPRSASTPTKSDKSKERNSQISPRSGLTELRLGKSMTVAPGEERTVSISLNYVAKGRQILQSHPKFAAFREKIHMVLELINGRTVQVDLKNVSGAPVELSSDQLIVTIRARELQGKVSNTIKTAEKTKLKKCEKDLPSHDGTLGQKAQAKDSRKNTISDTSQPQRKPSPDGSVIGRYNVSLAESVSIKGKSVCYAAVVVIDGDDNVFGSVHEIRRHPDFKNSAIFVPERQKKMISRNEKLHMSIRNRLDGVQALEKGKLVGQILVMSKEIDLEVSGNREMAKKRPGSAEREGVPLKKGKSVDEASKLVDAPRISINNKDGRNSSSSNSSRSCSSNSSRASSKEMEPRSSDKNMILSLLKQAITADNPGTSDTSSSQSSKITPTTSSSKNSVCDHAGLKPNACKHALLGSTCAESSPCVKTCQHEFPTSFLKKLNKEYCIQYIQKQVCRKSFHPFICHSKNHVYDSNDLCKFYRRYYLHTKANCKQCRKRKNLEEEEKRQGAKRPKLTASEGDPDNTKRMNAELRTSCPHVDLNSQLCDKLRFCQETECRSAHHINPIISISFCADFTYYGSCNKPSCLPHYAYSQLQAKYSHALKELVLNCKECLFNCKLFNPKRSKNKRERICLKDFCGVCPNKLTGCLDIHFDEVEHLKMPPPCKIFAEKGSCSSRGMEKGVVHTTHDRYDYHFKSSLKKALRKCKVCQEQLDIEWKHLLENTEESEIASTNTDDIGSDDGDDEIQIISFVQACPEKVDVKPFVKEGKEKSLGKKDAILSVKMPSDCNTKGEVNIGVKSHKKVADISKDFKVGLETRTTKLVVSTQSENTKTDTDTCFSSKPDTVIAAVISGPATPVATTATADLNSSIIETIDSPTASKSATAITTATASKAVTSTSTTFKPALDRATVPKPTTATAPASKPETLTGSISATSLATVPALASATISKPTLATATSSKPAIGTAITSESEKNLAKSNLKSVTASTSAKAITTIYKSSTSTATSSKPDIVTVIASKSEKIVATSTCFKATATATASKPALAITETASESGAAVVSVTASKLDSGIAPVPATSTSSSKVSIVANVPVSILATCVATTVAASKPTTGIHTSVPVSKSSSGVGTVAVSKTASVGTLCIDPKPATVTPQPATVTTQPTTVTTQPATVTTGPTSVTRQPATVTTGPCKVVATAICSKPSKTLARITSTTPAASRTTAHEESTAGPNLTASKLPTGDNTGTDNKAKPISAFSKPVLSIATDTSTTLSAVGTDATASKPSTEVSAVSASILSTGGATPPAKPLTAAGVASSATPSKPSAGAATVTPAKPATDSTQNACKTAAVPSKSIIFTDSKRPADLEATPHVSKAAEIPPETEHSGMVTTTSLSKRAVCKFYGSRTRCSNGSKCLDIHDMKNVPCRFWLRGYCRFAHKCRNKHSRN